MKLLHYTLSLTLAAVLVSCTPPETDVVWLDSGDITGISIERFDESVALEKVDDLWFVTEPLRTRANPATVDNLLAVLDQLSIESRVTTDPASYPQYGVDQNGAVLTISSPAGSQKIVVGRQGRELETQHIRIDDGEEVLLARGRINTTLRVDVWRYRVVIDLDPASITGALFRNPDGEYELTQVDGSWAIIDSSGTMLVTDERVAEWAAFFSPMMTDRFAEVTVDLVDQFSQRQIDLAMADGSVRTMKFLDLQGEWGVTVNDNETVYQIFGLRLGNLFPDILSFEPEEDV